MPHLLSSDFVDKVLLEIENLIPGYMENPIDKNIAEGNVAVCMIDETGNIYGKMYGENRARARQSFKIASTKAMQVWLTGTKTGEYERQVFTKEIAENAHGIEAPELIGWEGGQPVKLKNGDIISVGFSGFRGIIDLEIMQRAIKTVEFSDH